MPSYLYFEKEHAKKKTILDMLVLSIMMSSILVLQNLELEIYKEYFLQGERFNCDGIVVSGALEYVLEGEYFLNVDTNKLVAIGTCKPIGDVFIYTHSIGFGLLVFYGLLALIMYVMYKNKYKPTKQKGTNE